MDDRIFNVCGLFACEYATLTPRASVCGLTLMTIHNVRIFGVSHVFKRWNNSLTERVKNENVG